VKLLVFQRIERRVGIAKADGVVEVFGGRQGEDSFGDGQTAESDRGGHGRGKAYHAKAPGGLFLQSPCGSREDERRRKRGSPSLVQPRGV
jgi:hypothetical protein